MNTSIGVPPHATVAVPVRPVARVASVAPYDERPAPGALRRLLGYAEEAAIFLLAVILVPVVILLIGAPIALVLRALVEIAHRF